MRSRQTADTRVPMLCNQGKVPVSGRHDHSCESDQWGRAAGVLTLNPDLRVNWFVWFVLTSVLCPKSPPLNCLVSVCFTTLKLGLRHRIPLLVPHLIIHHTAQPVHTLLLSTHQFTSNQRLARHRYLFFPPLQSRQDFNFPLPIAPFAINSIRSNVLSINITITQRL